VPGNYYNKTPGTLFYTPDLSRQAFIDPHQRDNTFRLTWQASQKHKVTFLQTIQDNCLCFYAVGQNVSPEASGNAHQIPMRLTQVAWTYPVTSRLLLQSGVTYMPNGQYIERTAGVTTSDIPITELSTGYMYGAGISYADPNGQTGEERYDQTNGRFVLSYVTGSHAFKTGFTFFRATPRGDSTTQDPAVSYAFRKPTPDAAPVPVSVTYYAYPRWTKDQATKLALYAQDQWTLSRLTLNLGMRVETLHAWNPAQTKPAGRWTPAIDFARQDDVPNWKDVNPRFGAAYDLFGNGKTAVKGSVGRFVQAEVTTIASATNPQNAIVGSATRTWDDSDHDYLPHENELGPLSNNLFGTVFINTRYADDVLKGWGVSPYNWSASASLEHELRPGVGLTVGYFRRWYDNFRVTDNLKVTLADYDPYCITAPLNARLPGGGGNQVCGFYDIKPTAFGAVDYLVTRASNYGKQTEVYNGIEGEIRARFGKGGMLAGGVSTGRTVSDRCFTVDSPQEQQPGFCHVVNPFKAQTQIKVNGVYPLPWGLQASAVFQNLAGIPDSGVVPINSQGQIYGEPIAGASYVATNAEIAPSLRRDLGACAGKVPCTATATINLLAPFAGGYQKRLTQVDVRLTRITRLRRVLLRGMFDVYNLFNANTVLSEVTRLGRTYLQPTQILAGRLVKFSAQLEL
jgi:hypothetical protein